MANGLTQYELAAAIGVSQAAIARWEADDNPIGGPQQIALRTVLGNASGNGQSTVPRKKQRR